METGLEVCFTNVKSLLAVLVQSKTDTPVIGHIYYLTGHDGASADQNRPMFCPGNLPSFTGIGITCVGKKIFCTWLPFSA